MNDDELKDLESELRCFEPLPVSTELRARVARGLQTDKSPEPARRDRSRRFFSMALFAVAAVILVAIGFVVYQRPSDNENARPAPNPERIVQVDDLATDESDSIPPSIWAYRIAAVDSPQQLDLLLDQHARALLPPDEGLVCASGMIP